MTYDEAMQFIHSTDWLGSKPGLERITELLRLTGDPQKGIKAVHVAGTNGKGSFCAMLDSVLRASGYRTGLFTSPYIEFFEERICVCGKMISKDELADITGTVADAVKRMTDHPTEFEIITAIGFEYFRRRKIDIAIIECGMGGRLDSTNVIESPMLSVITGISLDHTQYLGDTVEKIAYEKAGIIKEGCPVLFGGGSSEAAAVIRSKAKEKGSPYFETDKSEIKNTEYSICRSRFDYGYRNGIELSLAGTYQPQNATNVLEAVDILKLRCGLCIPETAVYSGLKNAVWKGRFEKLSDNPPVFFDGGHNYEGVCAAVDTLKEYFGDKKAIIISGVMRDKDYKKIAAEISKAALHVITVKPDNPRALSSEEYAGEYAMLGVSSIPAGTFDEAVRLALNICEKEDRPLLCLGSLYSYSSIKNALYSIQKKEK